MHADGDWQAVEGALSKDMATLDEYLQTWKLKLSTTTTVSAVFHLNNKEAKRELKVNFNNKPPPFCSEPKYPGVTLDRSITYHRHLESLCKKLTSRIALLRQLAGSVNSHPSPGPFDCRVLRSSLVPQCSCPPHWPHHQWRLANCDWLTASYTSGQPSNPHRRPTCWASSQCSHTISRTPWHGAWTSAPLSAHPSIKCCCTAPHIETPICNGCTATHQLLWQQDMCGAVGRSSMERGVGRQPYKTPHFNSRHRYTHTQNNLPRRAWVRLNRLHTGVRHFHSCLYKWGMASSAACECGTEEQTVDHVVLQCPIHRPPHGLHSLTVLDDETHKWLLNTWPEI